MDILASIFAYLSCVTGIIGALSISVMVVFAPPNAAAPANVTQTAIIKQTTAKPNVNAKSDKLASDKLAAEEPAGAVTTVAQSTRTPPTPKPGAARSKVPTRAEYLRRLVQEQRARRWAYQTDPDFESRFLGYAD
jgi:hypothetical protein